MAIREREKEEERCVNVMARFDGWTWRWVCSIPFGGW